MAQKFGSNGVQTRLAFAFSLMLLVSAAGLAQVTIGLPPFGSFSGSSADVVNDANLNVHLSIPVVNKAGRGLPLDYVLGYDSSLWFPVSFSGQSAWTPAQYWGWGGVGQAGSGYVAYQAVPEYCVLNGNYYYFEELNNWTYYDAVGTPHPTTASVSNYSSTPCQGGTYPPSSATAIATDGSGYTIEANVSLYATVYGRGGEAINPPLMENGGPEAPGYGPGTITDSNGNEITFSVPSYDPFTVTTTDTLGTTALTLLAPTAGLNNPTTLTYTNPSGGSSQVTVNYSTYTVQTNFGCYGISEFGPSSEALVSSIGMPDGTSYTFTYESTPGYSGNVTGRIAAVTLPTGGTITYAYSGGSNGINCADGSTATLTRTTPDGKWTYTHDPTAGTTNVTDPQGNVTAYTFQGIYPTEEQINLGTSTVLETVYTCYNGATTPCNSTTITPPITQVTVTTARDNGLESMTNTDYNSYGLPTEVDEYGYGSGAFGPLLRTTDVSYDTSLGNNIEDRPSSVSVYNGGGSLVSQTTYGYDSNGNMTSLSTGGLTRSFTYSTGGVVATATDFAGNTTSFSYGDCNGSFPTQVSQPLSLTSSMAWDCNTGLVTSVTDPNNQTTSFSYDELYRLTQTNNPDGGQASTAYSDGPSGNIVTTTDLGAPGNGVDTAELDGLGRVIQTQLNSDPAGTDYVNTSYDALGRVASVTNPFRSSSDPTYGVTQYSYDALNRVTVVTDPDSNQKQFSYGSGSQLCSSSAYGLGYPAVFEDEGTHTWRQFTDSLGRIIEVDEMDPGNGNALDWNTCSSYDALGNLTQVVQGSQTRTYNYDMLSRLTSATTPESGTTTYSYSGCSGDPSNVCSRTDARGITTTYAYDALNRLISKSYSDGTPVANFWWDGSYAAFGNWSVNGLTNTKGRLFATCTSNAPASCPGGYTGTVYSYDAMGRVTSYWQATPYNEGSSAWQMTYNYDLAGDVTSWTHPAGFTLTNTINTAQQITQIQSSLVDSMHPQYLAQNIAYTPWGTEQTLENGCAGSGCTNTLETYAYNNRLQPVMIELGNPSNAAADYCLVYNYYWNVNNPSSCATPQQGGFDNGSVAGVFYQDNVNTSLSHTAAYQYDAPNRLTSAVATGNSTYNLAFSYDRYGNMTCTINGSTNGLCPQYSFNSANNQITNSGYTYDAAGDLTGDGTYTYQYDAEGREASVDGSSNWAAAYNVFGQVVQRYYAPAGETDSFLWDPSSHFIANWDQNGGFWWDEFVRSGGRYLADNREDVNATWIIHVNQLRSWTSVTSAAGQMIQDTLLYPSGSLWTEAGMGWGGMFANLPICCGEVGQYITPFRGYSLSQGRWLTPDPLGGDISNPQSLNRYAYALNNPTTFIDPSGLQCQQASDGTVDCDVFAPFPGGPEGGGAGGLGGQSPYAPLQDPVHHPCGTASTCVIPRPIPPTKPTPLSFPLGLRLPNQTFNQCMTQNATNYSAGGVFDLATGSTLGSSTVGQIAAGNTFTSLYAGVFGGSASGAASAAGSTAPDLLNTAIGSPLSYGRRTADIMSLNLEGKGGLPLALSPVPEIGEIQSVLSSASSVFNLGLDASTKGAIDAGLFGAELIGCSIP